MNNSGIRYAHTNIIAKDWRRLADFYCQVLGCEPVSVERDYKGEDWERLTGIKGATTRGRHIRVPGHGDNGPTLEIFQYGENDSAFAASINRPGLAHLAFEVPDIAATRAAMHEWGGRDYGELITATIPGAGVLTFQYVCDPEGNIVELQKWDR